MAVEEDAPVEGAKHAGSLFTKKVGPLPVWVWALAAAGIWYYFQKQQTSSGSTAIDPATGYAYGSAQDTAALAANSGGTASDTSAGTGTSGSTTAGKYADNNAWSGAAINFLVGVGIDPTAANEAIQQFLSSQQLTAQQQGDVNTAIQALGPPPNLPGPVGTPPAPIVTPPAPPAGTVYAANPPGGLVTNNIARTTIGLKWSKTANATGYLVTVGPTSTASSGHETLADPSTSTTVGNLKPNTLYYFRVTANPAKAGAPFASASARTAK